MGSNLAPGVMNSLPDTEVCASSSYMPMPLSAAALTWQTCQWSFGPTSCDEPFARQKWAQKKRRRH